MLTFLIQNLSTIIVAAIILVIFVAILVSQIKSRKKGKTSCGCGCDHCPSSSICHKH